MLHCDQWVFVNNNSTKVYVKAILTNSFQIQQGILSHWRSFFLWKQVCAFVTRSSLGSLPFFGKATDQILNFAYRNFRPFSHSADYPHWSIFVINYEKKVQQIILHWQITCTQKQSYEFKELCKKRKQTNNNNNKYRYGAFIWAKFYYHCNQENTN